MSHHLELLILVTVCLGLNSCFNVIHNRDSWFFDETSEDFILKSTRISTKGGCVVFCEEDDLMSLEYNTVNGTCICHSALPDAMSFTYSPHTEFYVNPDKFHHIPTGCQSVVSNTGYVYDSLAHMCYKVHTQPLTWVSAKVRCEIEGGVLVKADTLNKMLMVEELVWADGRDYFLGATDIADGVWRWIADNSTVADSQDLFFSFDHCLGMTYDNDLIDAACDGQQLRFICEILIP